jgi:hypothetical protein
MGVTSPSRIRSPSCDEGTPDPSSGPLNHWDTRAQSRMNAAVAPNLADARSNPVGKDSGRVWVARSVCLLRTVVDAAGAGRGTMNRCCDVGATDGSYSVP